MSDETLPPSATILPFHRMTAADYDAARERLRQQYGEKAADANGRREQELAALFHRSGWTQDELAAKEGKGQTWVNYQLRFGRFLQFITTCDNSKIPANLTEGRFRKYWERVEGSNERERFFKATKLIENEVTLRKPRRPLGAEIEKHLDGKWHKVEDIAEALETDVQHVLDTISNLSKSRASIERRRRKGVAEFKGYSKDKTVSLSELREKMLPILVRLEEQGKKSALMASPGSVALLAHQLRKLLDAWAQ